MVCVGLVRRRVSLRTKSFNHSLNTNNTTRVKIKPLEEPSESSSICGGRNDWCFRSTFQPACPSAPCTTMVIMSLWSCKGPDGIQMSWMEEWDKWVKWQNDGITVNAAGSNFLEPRFSPELRYCQCRVCKFTNCMGFLSHPKEIQTSYILATFPLHSVLMQELKPKYYHPFVFTDAAWPTKYFMQYTYGIRFYQLQSWVCKSSR